MSEKRYIDKARLIKAIEDLPNCYNGFSDTFDKACIIGVIEEQPTIDPKRGKWTNSEMDEAFRIADEVRMAVECKTAKECWELARNGEIQRVKHGRWVMQGTAYGCSLCGEGVIHPFHNYCPDCGARMDEVTE